MDPRTGGIVYTVDDYLGDVTMIVENVGVKKLGTSRSVGAARPGGDGTTGVFKYKTSPEETIRKYEILGENFQVVVGTGIREGLKGFRYHFKRSFLEGRTRGISGMNVGNKEKEDQAIQFVLSIRHVIIWCDMTTGECRGLDIAMEDEKLSIVVVRELLHRNLEVRSPEYQEVQREVTSTNMSALRDVSDMSLVEFADAMQAKAVEELFNAPRKWSTTTIILVNLVVLVVIWLLIILRRIWRTKNTDDG